MLTTPTHCPYCALQCGLHLAGGVRGSEPLTVHPNPHFPVNNGGLCVKGWSSAATVAHGDRLLHPLLRNHAGELVPASWNAALEVIGERIQAVQAAHGRDSVGVLGSGSLTNEKVYLLGKFARVALGTSNIDYNGRFCMSSAAAAANSAFGLDRGLPFPLADIAQASVVLLVGANPAETMPPIMQYFQTQQASGGTLIVVDPRRTATAVWASKHLRIRPGTDAALAHGLLHVLIRDRLIDDAYIAARTEGFDEVKRLAMTYWPERVEQITGVPESFIVEAARLLGNAQRPMILSARGVEQHAHGVATTGAYINVALALGAPGRPGAGYGTLTGQGNGQGGREHGQKADQLPGYRRIDDPAARRHIAAVWKVPAETLPQRGKSAYELMESLGRDVRALFVMGFNLVVSAPNAREVEARLRSLETLIVADYFLSETAALATVVLPAAQWAEEDGTMTNLEGRVIRRRAAMAPPVGVRTDLEILSAMAAALGKGHLFAYESAEDVFNELRAATTGGIADYGGITYERIEQEDGVFWPCPSTDHPGTPRLFADRFYTANGKARFFAAPHGEVADARDDEYTLFLTTGRVLAQYQSGNQTRRVEDLLKVSPEPIAEIHTATAKRAGLVDGAMARLTTRRGSASFRVKTTRLIREDTIFVPFHWGGEQSINRLTSPALDPTSRMPAFKACAVRVDAL